MPRRAKSEPVLITTARGARSTSAPTCPARADVRFARGAGRRGAAYNPRFRDIRNRNLASGMGVDAVAGSPPELERDEALKRETLDKLARLRARTATDFAAMQVSKVGRMWFDYNRASTATRAPGSSSCTSCSRRQGCGCCSDCAGRVTPPVGGPVVGLVVTAVNSSSSARRVKTCASCRLLIAGGVGGVVLARRAAISGRPAPAYPGSGGRSEPPRARDGAAPSAPGAPSPDAAGVR